MNLWNKIKTVAGFVLAAIILLGMIVVGGAGMGSGGP